MTAICNVWIGADAGGRGCLEKNIRRGLRVQKRRQGAGIQAAPALVKAVLAAETDRERPLTAHCVPACERLAAPICRSPLHTQAVQLRCSPLKNSREGGMCRGTCGNMVPVDGRKPAEKMIGATGTACGFLTFARCSLFSGAASRQKNCRTASGEPEMQD